MRESVKKRKKVTEFLLEKIFIFSPTIGQLHIKSWNLQGLSIPVAYALRTGAKTAVHEGILLCLKNVTGELRNIKEVVSDFEKAEIKALSDILLHVRFVGCIFHSSQVFTTKIITFFRQTIFSNYLIAHVSAWPPRMHRIMMLSSANARKIAFRCFGRCGQFQYYSRTL